MQPPEEERLTVWPLQYKIFPYKRFHIDLTVNVTPNGPTEGSRLHDMLAKYKFPSAAAVAAQQMSRAHATNRMADPTTEREERKETSLLLLTNLLTKID